MTGRGPYGGPPRRDPWRGGRDGSPPSSAPVSDSVEVEELPPQALALRPKARVPLVGVIAVGALAALLAGGVGLLGGRPGATPGVAPTNPGGDGASTVPTTAPTVVARVRPWAPCGSRPEQPPDPVLEVDGRQHFGQVELLDFDIGLGLEGIPPVIGEDNLRDAVEVRMDAVTEIWIPGGACAVAWNIALTDPAASTTRILESIPNAERDPAVAAQNRFQVYVAPHAGDQHLRAILVFEELAVRATWSIRVPELEPPSITLTAGDRVIPTVIGCDVTQRLANGWEQPLSRCGRDVVREPARRAEVAPGEPLDFEMEGWNTANVTAYCGVLTDRTFLPRAEPTCLRARDLHVAGVRFPAPFELGPWTLAVTACASRIRVTGRGFEELCGTWYANIRVRD